MRETRALRRGYRNLAVDASASLTGSFLNLRVRGRQVG
jgi:hypothetical protein